MNKTKRFLGLFLIVFMLLAFVPLQALANTTDEIAPADSVTEAADAGETQATAEETPTGTLTNAYTSASGYCGECGGNAKESFGFKLYYNDTFMGSTFLNDVGNIIDGDVYVFWNIKLDAASNTDEYWTMSWEIAPTIAMQPNRVEQWVDGVCVANVELEPNWSDRIFPVVAAVTDADGKILSYVNDHEGATLANAFANANGNTVTLLNDIKVTEVLTVVEGTSATLDLNGYDAVLEGEAYIFVKSNGPSSVGMLTVKDTSKNADGRIVGVICVNGTLNLESGTITSAGYGVSGIPATVVLQPDSYANYPKLNVTGGTIEFTGDLDELGDLASFATAIFASGTNGRGSDMNFSKDATVKSTGSCVLQNVKISDHGDVTVTNGTFKCGKGFEIFNIDTTGGAEVAVSGGTFSSAIPEKYCADGFELVENADGTYGVEEAVSYVAEINGTGYATIDEAIAAWTNNTTLTLLADVTLSDVVTLKSTEHHILNLGTYTMTAASGKNAFVIQACGTGDSERTAITINADATNPGGINAGSKCVVYYKYADGGISGNDRPIIKINGGVFNGATSSFGTAGIYTIGTAARKCATLNISGGEFNCSINGSGKSKLIISGGTFNYSVGSQGDSTALRLISGGTFKTFGFMTADSNNTKFWFGTSMANSNVGVYVDDNGYIVVGGTVITEAGEKFEASSANYSGANSLLQYSSAKTNGLYYTSVEEAFADNNTTSGKVTVYADEIDMSGISYKGTIVVPADSSLTITNAPEGLKLANEAGEKLEVGANGTVFKPVAQIGETKYASAMEALLAAVESGASEVKILANVREAMPTDVELVLNANLTITADSAVEVKFYNQGTAYDFIFDSNNNNTLTIGQNVTFQLEDRVIWAGYYGNDVDIVVDGTLAAYQIWHGADTTVNATGTLKTTGEALVMRRGATLTVNGGKVEANYFNFLAGNIDAKNNATIDCGAFWIANTGNYVGEGNVNISILNSTLTSSGNFKSSTTHADGVTVAFVGSTIEFKDFDGYGASVLDASTSVAFDNCEVELNAITNNGTISFTNISLTDANIVGTGTAYFYGDIDFSGANNVTCGINGQDFDMTVNKGATLLISRFVLGYNRNITVEGEIEDAHAFDPTGKTPSLKFNSTSGTSVGGWGTGNLTVKDAYVELDNSSWKNATGTYDWSFTNSYVSATSFTNNNAQGSADATWTVTFNDSVLVAKNYIKNGVGTTYNFTNGSVATTGSLRIDGVMNIDATSSVTTTSQQNNKVGAADEHGGINGTVNVDGTLTIGSNAKTQLEVLGGVLNVGAGAEVALGDNTLTLDSASKLEIDLTGAQAGEYAGITGTVTNNGTIEVENGSFIANIVDGKIVLTQAVAQIGDVKYATLSEALEAAKVMTGDVTIEIFDKATLNSAITGSFDSITFVGKDTDAEIYLDVQGYITATGKKVAFKDLILSKSAGGYVYDGGFMNLAFGVYDVVSVNYTNCTFLNGACASSGKVTFTGCTFYRSHDRYGLWVYGADKTTVDGCTFADIRGIKFFSEGKLQIGDLIVKNTNFSAAVNKPAIVLTSGKSVTLENNTYSSKGVFELDLDGVPNGTAVTSDVPPTCVNDNGACGVLVDGKIYTTVAQAAEVAVSGSNVKLLFDSAETVEFGIGVNLDKNDFEANGVTVAIPVAQIGEVQYSSLQAAIDAAKAGDKVIILADVADEAVTVNKNVTITSDVDNKVTLNNVSITINGTDVELTVSNLKFTGSSYINAGNGKALTVTGVEANVEPAKITGRAAFIVTGTSEPAHGLKLVVTDNVINSAQSGTDYYSAAIFGWRYIDDGSVISGNTFGTADKRYTFVAVKTMNAMGGATITIAENTIYGTSESYVLLAFDLYQNCSRANAYTVISNSNVIDATVGSSYPVIAFNISGNTAFADSTNITLLDNGTTVNGNALTLADIDANDAGSDYDKYYGVDVVTDANGKIIGGTFSGDMAALANDIAEGYALVNGTVKGLNGSGTEADPYQIGTAEELFLFAELVNNGKYVNVYVVLTADIDLEQEDWTSIGTSAHPFTGTFDGQGHTISNVWSYGTGLFGFTSTGNYVDSGLDGRATIKNLTINGVEVYNQSTSAVGGLVGQAGRNTEISNVTVTGYISIYGYGYVGGIVGQGYVRIDNCKVIGVDYDNEQSTIDANYWAVGGIIGHAGSEGGSSITNCSVENVYIRSTYYGAGAIAGVGTTGPIENVTAEKVAIEAGSSASANGYLIGCNYGKITGNSTAKDVILTVDDKVVEAPKDMIASVNGTYYVSLEAAFAAANEGDTIVLLADATPALTSQRAITKASVIDLNGNTLTLKEDDLYFGTTTFQNGTIVVDPSVKPSTAVFWMFADQTLTFDGVKLVATGVSGTYLIGLDGNNSDLNLLNGSEIVVNNATALDLDIICVNASTGNDIVIDDSKINVTNLDGRVLFRGNYTISGASEITLSGITKAGIRIEAGQTLSIEDTSVVTITGDLRDGGIHLTDATATYTKADTATVNATVNKPVATIGSKSYFSLEDAFKAAQNGDEVKILVAGEYKLTVSGKDITITGAVDGVEFVGITAYSIKSSVTFNNITFTYDMASGYKGLQDAGDMVYNNCTFNGQVFLYGTSETFNNCTFIQTDENNYNVWTYAAKEVAFNGCTFNAAGRSVLVYNEGSTYAVDVTFTDTTFVSSKAVDGKAAIEIDTSYCAGANVTVNNTTATGFGAGNVSGNSLWNNKKGNYTDANNDITVVVNGETVLAPVTFVAQVGDKKFASLQEAFQAATNGAVIEILNDVTIDDKWDCRSTGAKFTVPVTIDGNGKTIKFTGAIIDNNWNTVFRFEEVATVKDLTIDVSEATGVQRIISAKLGGTFDNCTFIGKGDGYGIIFGEGAGTALSNVTVTITNSTFKNFGRGVSDNRNDQDAKAIVVDKCNFENSKVLLGASESITFTNNTVVNGQVDIKSYSNIANVVVEATGNTLEAGKNFITANPANVTAQGEFALPVATANGKYCFSLQEAIIAAAPNGTVELLSDVVVDKWTMITEKPIGSNQLITLVIDDLTIDGNGHTLTVKSIESAGNGDHLFDDARNLTVKDLTIVNESGKNGGIGLYSGSIENVTFVGGIGVFPQASANTITITGCTFDTTGDAIYYESARDNLVVTGNTFDVDGYAIILRGKEVFANNTIVSGKVNVASSASSTVTGNSFGDNRFKVYNGATATIAENTINNLVFNDGTITKSVFTNNTFSEAAQAAYDEVKGLSGSGTEADPYKIGSVEELNIFAKRVNDGSYTTEYFVLTADIDMNGATWERGIGDGINATFDGKFNGQGFAIKNLNLAPKADSDGYLCGGLFGYTYGAAEIKNLVLENITVKTNDAGHNVGVLVGFANNKGGKLNVSNVTVKNATIDAPNAYGVGAIVGYSYRDMGTIENCVVDGANITGYSFVGGITGYSYSNAVITGCSVNNATIKATSKGAGGIAGLALGGSEISGNTVANTVVTAPTNWGYVIGEVASEGIVVSSNNASEPQVGGAYSTGKPVQAKVGDKYYTTLEAAIEAANGETVVLLNTIVIGKGEEAVIDLKGATVVYETSVANVTMIRNNGTLTIKDSVGDGKLSIKYTGASFGYGVGVYTIVNQGGTLNIEGGTIENLTNVSASMYDAIDNNSTLGDTVLNISGGVVSCPAYIGIRQFANSTTAKNIVNITGGTVIGGNTSVWVQNPNSYNNNAELNISGGTINGRLLADDSSAFVFAVNGGTFSVPVADKFCQEGYHSHAKANGTFAVEEINLKYTAGVDATCTTAGVKPGTYCADCMVIITLPEPISAKGHSYNAEVTDPTCTAKGYTTHTCTVCGDTYVDSYVDMVAHTEEEIPAVAPTVDAAGSKAGVKCSVCGEIIVAPETIPALVAVAQIGNTKFETLAAAIAAANAGDTIEILGNIEANSVIMIDKSITINGNGYNVTSSANRVFRVTTANVEVTLNDVNMVSTAFSTYTSDVRGISIDSNLTGVNLTLNDCSVEFDPTSGSDWAYAVNVTGGSANILTINGGTYEGANVINVWGDDHEIVINGATLTSLYNAPQNGYYGQCVRFEGTGNEVVISNTTFNGDHAIAIGEATKDSNDVAQFNNVNNTKRYLAKIDSEYFYTLADAFATAESGDTIVLLGSITIDGDNTIVVKKSVTLDLNGCTISAVTDQIGGNRNVFDVRGTLTVMDGTITYEHTGANMGWGSSTNVFNVTAGGILNIENATVKNLGGSDMAFVAHLNNWGEVTLNVKNSTLESTYVAVRVFNSGYDMNNVTIENSKLSGDSAAFWVHNNTVADFGSQEKADAQEALLNFNIFNGNTFVSDGKVGVIRYGFTNSARLDKDGNCVHNTTVTVPGKEATCTETGLTDGSKCEYCDATVVEQEPIPVIAHIAGEAVKENENAPTCTATGSYDLVVYCTECDAKLSSETVTVDKLAHNPGDVEIANKTDATCTEDGKYDLVVYCSACDTELSTGTITIPATGHAFSEWIFDAENCKVVRTCANDATHIEEKSVVAKNGNEYYETLQDAVNAGGTVVLLKNIALDSSVTVSGTVALNLNGKTITGTDNNVKGNFYLFNVTKGASFTVGGEGEITLTATTERNWNASSVVIANNQGTVTVNGGTIKHLGGTSMAYALDNLTNGKNTIATMVVNGGTIDSTYFAIRQFANDGTNNLTINGGDIGYVWMQSPNANANVANTTVTGGSVDGICLSGANANATLKALATCVGEVYGTAPAGYKFANVDGYYVVVPCEYVAQVGDNKYESFEEAIAAANANGGTVVLLENITLNSTIKVTGNVTLDLNGKTITGTDNSTGSFSLFTNNGEFTVTGDGAITLVANNNRGWNGYSTVISNTVGGKLVVNGGTIKHLGGTDMAYAIDNLTNGKGTYAETVINGGEIISTYSAIRQFLNGTEAQNILTINGGTVKGIKRAIFFQDPSKNANSGTLTIGENASINGTVYLDVTEGSTEWPVTVSVATAALKNGSTVTTENVPSGYHVTEKNGTVVVEACTAVTDEAKAPTCTETGLTAGSHCSVCGEVLEAQTVVDATGHTAGEAVKENENAPTCTATGSYDNVTKCTVCGEELSRETVTVPVIAHSYNEEVTDPTCTAKGYTTYTCSVCGDTYVDNYVDMVPHTLKTIPAVNATCTATGLTEGKYCEVCMTITVVPTVTNKVAHTEVEIPAVAPTYENAGSTAGVKCSVCGTIIEAPEEIPALKAVAKVGDEYFSTLQEAIDAANVGDTITLLADITVASDLSNAAKGLYNIAADDKITIDLNGFAIDVTDNSNGNFIVFYNYGELTIKNGTVNLTSTNNRGWNAQSTIILNRGGILNVESGEYIHNGGTDMAFAIDNSGNSYGDATTNINGGTISSTYRAIRNRMDTYGANGGGNGEATLNINGGTISGDKNAVWGQVSSTGCKGTINVTGGQLISATGNANISVGTDTTGEIKTLVSGGTFSAEVSEEYCAEGYVSVENEDGSFGVQKSAEESIWAGISVTAGASLDMNFYVDMSKLDANKSYYAKAIKVHTEACGTASVEINIPQSEWVADKHGTKIVVKTIAAREMNCDIQVQIFEVDAENGDKAVSTMTHKSIVDYAMHLINSSDDKDLKTLLVDMLNYGTEAQIYFNHDVSEKANRLLTKEQTELATGTVDPYDTAYLDSVGNHANNLSFTLDDTIDLNLWFSNFGIIENFDKSLLTAKVSYTDFAGYEISYDVANTDIEFRSNDQIAVVKVNTLSSADVNTVVTCELMYNGESITTVYANIAGGCYLAKEGNTPEKAVALQIMKYGQSAYNYFSK